MFYTTQHLDLEISFWSASLLRVVQVAGMPLLFVPIILISYLGLPAEKSNSIAGLVSFMRNIGSSIGTSLVTTVVARQAQFHQVHLVAHTTPVGTDLYRRGLGSGGAAGCVRRRGFAGDDAGPRAAVSVGDQRRRRPSPISTPFGSSRSAPRSWSRCPLRLKRNEPGGGSAVAAH